MTETVVAKVQGAPLHEFPENLYIPPDALRVILEETFEGPLDLLLYLIRRRNLDIMAVSVTEVTEQYLGYIAVMERLRIELAAEYLLMAALLAEIKSRLLLPKPVAEEEEEDPRAQLVRRLKEYERIKRAAVELDDLPRLGRDLFPVLLAADLPPRTPKLPKVTLDQLADAFRQVLMRAERGRSHAVPREALSVRERMVRLLELLEGGKRLAFELLFDPAEGRAGLVVTFLALLELCREGRIEVSQREPLAPIQVQLR